MISMIFLFFVIYLNLHIIATILTQDWKPRLNDSLYAVLAALLFSFSTVFLFFNISHLLVDATAMLLLFLYLYKLKSYSVKKSIILLLTTLILASLSEIMAVAIFGIATSAITDIHVSLLRSLNLLSMTISAIVLATLFTKITKRFRETINQSKKIQTILLCGILLIVISIQLNLLIAVPEGGWTFAYRHLLILNAILAVIYGTVVLVSFLLYARSLKMKYEARQKETEQQNLQYYMNEIEQQYTATRKFEHDYQNILLSFDRFIEESDFAGLKEYYMSSVKKTFDNTIQNRFVLERLGKIKIKELKSILAAKLMTAKQMDIDTTFEVNTEIDHLPMDSLTLMRMIGIIMDNAIEELATLGNGKLMVGCFKNGNNLTFIVQNTCRPDIPSIRQLKSPNFSTKGDGRGHGLNNLSELADSHHNIVLETNIIEGSFIQKLTIEGRNGMR